MEWEEVSFVGSMSLIDRSASFVTKCSLLIYYINSVPPISQRIALSQYSAQWRYGGGSYLHHRAHDLYEEQ